MCGDGGREAEAYQTHANFSQLLMKDNYASHQCPEHALITWIDQPLASFLHLSSAGMGTASGTVGNNPTGGSLAVPGTSNSMLGLPGSSSVM